MYSHVTNITVEQIEVELREEKSKFARAFHRGKSMTELKDVVEKIHTLEQKIKGLLQHSFGR